MNLASLIFSFLMTCIFWTNGFTQLTLTQVDDYYMIAYAGGFTDQGIGIPAWTVNIDKANTGNFREIFLPPFRRNLIKMDFPAFVPRFYASKPPNYAQGDPPDSFSVKEETDGSITIYMEYEHQGWYRVTRTYTFTKEGVELKGILESTDKSYNQVSLSGAWWPANVEIPNRLLPIRNQGTAQWYYLDDQIWESGRTLPFEVKYPMEAELRVVTRPGNYVHIKIDESLGDLGKNLIYYHYSSSSELWIILGALQGFPSNTSRPYKVRLHFIDSTKTAMESNGQDIKKAEVLSIAPNPFSQKTTIVINNGRRKTEDGKGKNLELKIYDINGKMVKDLSSIYLLPSTFYLQAEGLSPGVYIIRLKAGKYTYWKKAVLAK
jgi:hypothetical protein